MGNIYTKISNNMYFSIAKFSNIRISSRVKLTSNGSSAPRVNNELPKHVRALTFTDAQALQGNSEITIALIVSKWEIYTN